MKTTTTNYGIRPTHSLTLSPGGGGSGLKIVGTRKYLLCECQAGEAVVESLLSVSSRLTSKRSSGRVLRNTGEKTLARGEGHPVSGDRFSPSIASRKLY